MYEAVEKWVNLLILNHGAYGKPRPLRIKILTRQKIDHLRLVPATDVGIYMRID